MKNIISTIVFLLITAVSTCVLAQHNPHYSQFMFNKLTINPAYAGSKETLSLMALYRYQWKGLIGAPKTMNFNVHGPISNKRIGLGLNIVTDEIGMFKTNFINGMYAYRLKMNNDDVLSGGMAFRFTHSRLDWSKAVIYNKEDAFIPMDRPDLTSFNVGFGLYYSSKNYYAGLSIPSILKKSLYDTGSENQRYIKDLRTYYLMAGLMFDINDFIAIKPSLLMSYIRTAPFDIDINLSIVFFNSIWIGGTYRKNDSAGAVLQYSLNQQIIIGVAADYTLSQLNRYTPGSLELSLEYVFNKPNNDRKRINFFD